MEYIWKIVSAVVFLCATSTGWNLPIKPDYDTHMCKRDCLKNATPMRCEYNFTVEHYQTLSRACYNCPYNISDCHRPHCVAADGLLRAIKVVNRMMPGPALHVCQDDTVVVNVYNEMSDFEGTSIHWHGILQQGTPHMDGVAMVTQCPISPHSVFQYKFTAQNPGTHYWHAHAGFQRGDGVFGSLVVRDTSSTSVMRHYDYDLAEHTIIVQDWLDQFASSKFALHHHGMNDNEPSSILINGRGTLINIPNSDTMSHDGHSMGMGDKATNDMEHSMDGETGDTMTHESTTHEMDMDIPEMTTSKHGDGMDMSGMTTSEHGDGMDMSGTTTSGNHTGMDMDSGSSMDGHTDMAQPDKNTRSHVPYSVFRVTKNKRYRFRFISNGILNCPLKISVEKHNLTIIASDGHDIKAVEVESFTIFAGERYDVVVNANQKIGNYWMHIIGLGDCARKNTSQTAIIRYNEAKHMIPESGHSYADGDRQGPHANPMLRGSDSITVGQMTSEYSPEEVYTSHDVKTFYMAMDFNEVGNYRYVDPNFYSLSTMTKSHTGGHANHLYALQMNHITFTMPASPVLSQYHDVDEDRFCNETSASKDCNAEFCECVHRIKVGHGDIVEFVLIGEANNGMGNHPMHLHGHSFFVLGMDTLNASTTRREIEELDAKGRLSRNLINPIKKDTVMVPDGGYTIIRFKANNPGFWLFHCHVDFHFSLGMSVVIQVGDIGQMKSTPNNFPRCGSWKFTEDSKPNTCTSSASSAAIQQRNTIITSTACLLLSMLLFAHRLF